MQGIESAGRRRGHWALLLVLGAMALLTGCGGTSTDESDSSDSSAGSATTANLDASKALLAKYGEEPEFVPPGPGFDAKKEMAGKKIMSIPVSSQIPITQVLETAEAAQAKRIGFEFTHWQNQGKSDQWIQGIQTAIDQNYDAIELIAIDPSSLRPQIERARDAGIPVLINHFGGFGWEPPDFVGGAVRLPYYETGRIMAAWAAVQTEGKANVLSVVAEDLVSTADVVKGMQDEFGENCPDCKLETVNVPTVEWATGVQNEVRSGLQRDPNVNYVIPIYDAMTQYAIAGLRASGMADSVGMATFNGTPFALDLVREGKLDMNLGENEDWIARAMLDASMRAATGMDVPKDTYKAAPLYIFTKDNVEQAGTPPDPAKGYGTAYESGFDEMWGL